ncbi:hypothetical protein COU19_00360 [Candidatus Kaiserbacteria bacterium CG10_big_fil_rev_8_21_14_0_10_56_12]|uniref:Uncharacterized protein n=1 Tax=Candidatus Kaiserbacteria bacterium CG10_big_fil_rev_8_21_14_0_10_56_12 TaxID=1974611 RepID=A0A2H0UAG4_9BACT|nr:MAG: hypothetical protein COU19_00360 [Candidatus Kaiserbacteria bacterium CG10_big_fil_rev_8_21_14_0_10_56_12]
MSKNLGIATRFYGLTKGDVERLAVWVDAACALVPASHVFVAIHTEIDESDSLAYMKKHYPKVVAFAVTPWGKVVQAPNALLMKAAALELKELLFVSTEYPVTSSLIKLLRTHVDTKTLVVGARLGGHAFAAAPKERVVVTQASGLQIPWNTCTLWLIAPLVHTGFVLAADSLHDPDNAGMEEMGTIAAQQILWPGKAVAKLVSPNPGDLVLNTHGWKIERHERFVRNLKSKNARSAAQLERLSLPTPTVEHIG